MKTQQVEVLVRPMRILLAVLCTVLLVPGATPLTQREALDEFFAATGGLEGRWSIDTGWTDGGCVCKRFGVTCTAVERLLEGVNGLVVSDLGAQCPNSSVTGLYLPHNGLHGRLPTDRAVWRALSTLVTLDLSDSSLGGATSRSSVSAQSTVNEGLSISSNLRRGKRRPLRTVGEFFRQEAIGIPKTMSELSSLRTLHLASCGLSGLLPSNLFDAQAGLVELRELSLDGNQLTGNIPDMNGTVNLASLKLDQNRFSGSVPSLPPSITYVSLRDNILRSSSDRPCSDWFQGASNLRYVILAANELTDNITQCDLFRACAEVKSKRTTNLEFVDISDNDFVGELPAGLASCSGLAVLDLSGNKLSGSLAKELQNIWMKGAAGAQKQVQVFFDLNDFAGRIPDWDAQGMWSVGQFSVAGNDYLASPKTSGSPLPSCFTADGRNLEYFSGDFTCPRIIPSVPNQRLRVVISPRYYNYSLCTCGKGTVGIPPTCVQCSTIPSVQEGVKDCFGSGLTLEEGYYAFLLPATSTLTPVDWVDNLGIVECPSTGFRKTACNAGGTCKLLGRGAGSSGLSVDGCSGNTDNPADLCEQGYSDFLCSKCTCAKPLELRGGNSSGFECFYRSGNRCVSCNLPSGSIMALCLISAFALLILVNFLKFAGFLVSVEIVALCVVVGVSPDTWWLLDLLIGVLVMQFVTRSTEHRDAKTRKQKIKLSGLFKSIIFFVQTTASLNENSWPDRILQTFGVQLDIANLNFRGLECLWPELFANSTVQLLFSMGMPIVLLCVALVVFFFVWVVQWLRDLVLYRCAPSAKRKRPESWKSFGLRCARATLFLIYVSYFNMVNKILAVFNCEQVAGRSFMSSAPWVRCGNDPDGEWFLLRTLALIFTATHVLGIPILFGVLLVQRERVHRVAREKGVSLQGSSGDGKAVLRAAANHSALDEVLIFLTENYDEDGWWFDLVFILRRLALSALIFAIPRSSSGVYQVTGVTFVVLLSCCFQVAVQPLRSKIHNALELAALIVIGLTYAALQGIKSTNNEPPSVVWVIFALNVAVLAAFGAAVSYAARYWQQLFESIQAARKGAWLKGLQYRGSWRSEGVGIESETADMSVTLIGSDDEDDIGVDEEGDLLFAGVDTVGRATLDEHRKLRSDRQPLLQARD